MGWESSKNWIKKKDVINDLLHQFSRNQWKVIDKASTSSGAYFYIHTQDGQKFICCAMIHKEDGQFLVKTILESMGPFICDCPERFLKYQENVGGYSSLWREKVKSFHYKKNMNFLGKNIQINNQIFKVLYKRRRSYLVVEKSTGKTYILGPKLAQEAIILEKENLKDKIKDIK